MESCRAHPHAVAPFQKDRVTLTGGLVEEGGRFSSRPVLTVVERGKPGRRIAPAHPKHSH